jgi:hypothetical protein
VNKQSLSLPITLNDVETRALIDSGAGGKFIDQNFANKLNLHLRNLEEPITVYDVDGTRNKTGTIKHEADVSIQIGGTTLRETLMVTGLGKQKIILGYPWLSERDPSINWKNGSISIPIGPPLQEGFDLLHEPGKMDIDSLDIGQLLTTDTWINAKTTTSQVLHKKSNSQEIKTLEQMVPSEFHSHLKVVEKKASDRFPTSHPWDHKIDLKPGFIPKSGKIYSLTPAEDQATKEFIDENLAKDYIVPRHLPGHDEQHLCNQNRRRMDDCIHG